MYPLVKATRDGACPADQGYEKVADDDAASQDSTKHLNPWHLCDLKLKRLALPWFVFCYPLGESYLFGCYLRLRVLHRSQLHAHTIQLLSKDYSLLEFATMCFTAGGKGKTTYYHQETVDKPRRVSIIDDGPVHDSGHHHYHSYHHSHSSDRNDRHHGHHHHDHSSHRHRDSSRRRDSLFDDRHHSSHYHHSHHGHHSSVSVPSGVVPSPRGSYTVVNTRREVVR